MTSAVEVTGLTLLSGPTVLLDRVDLTVPRGRIVAIVGRGGVGKSALLGVLVGQVTSSRTTGEVTVLDHPVPERISAARRAITWVERSGVLESHLTVRQNLHLILRLARHPLPARTEVDRVLRESDLPDRTFDRQAGLLTAREGLAVWIAAARLRGSLLVLLDDPTALLRPGDVARAASLIRDLCSTGTTVLLATRDRRFADEIAQTVHILEGGRLSAGHPTGGLGIRRVAEFVAPLM